MISGRSPRNSESGSASGLGFTNRNGPQALDARRQQRPVGLVEARLAVRARRCAQRAVEVVRPRVVVALDRLARAAALGQHRTAVAADVQERAQLAVAVRGRRGSGLPPASVARNEPGSATWSARPPYCQERAKIRSARGAAAPRRSTRRTEAYVWWTRSTCVDGSVFPVPVVDVRLGSAQAVIPPRKAHEIARADPRILRAPASPLLDPVPVVSVQIEDRHSASLGRRSLDRISSLTPLGWIDLFYETNSIRGGCGLLGTIILLILLLGLVGLGVWFVVRALGGRRR